VARCPHLWLEENGQTPFPFPSVSHHCYVSLPGRPAAQQEQRKYCLTKRYASCPLFPSPPVEEAVAVPAQPAPEATWPVTTPEPVLQEAAEERKAEKAAARPPERIIPPEQGPEPVAGLISTEPIRPPVEEAGPSEPGPVVQIAAEELPPPSGPAPATFLSRVAPWAAGGVVALVLLCTGMLLAVRIPLSGSGIDGARLDLPSLLPAALILVSVLSLGGAALLLGVLVWLRRRGTAQTDQENTDSL
jgi:hypothetical protein